MKSRLKRTACSVMPGPLWAWGSLMLVLAALLAALRAGCTSASGTSTTVTSVPGARPTASAVNPAKLSLITVTAYDYSFAMPTTFAACRAGL